MYQAEFFFLNMTYGQYLVHITCYVSSILILSILNIKFKHSRFLA